jgi:hypothetical protein
MGMQGARLQDAGCGWKTWTVPPLTDGGGGGGFPEARPPGGGEVSGARRSHRDADPRYVTTLYLPLRKCPLPDWDVMTIHNIYFISGFLDPLQCHFEASLNTTTTVRAWNPLHRRDLFQICPSYEPL